MKLPKFRSLIYCEYHSTKDISNNICTFNVHPVQIKYEIKYYSTAEDQLIVDHDLQFLTNNINFKKQLRIKEQEQPLCLICAEL